MKEMIIVTSAFPFVPAQLNLAHFASTYIPADVYCRFLKIFGKNAIHVSATDFHSFYASKDGNTIDKEMCKKYDNWYKKLFNIMEINFDNYITTDNNEHIELVNKTIKKLLKSNQLILKDSTSYICKECKSFVPKKIVTSKYEDNDNCNKCPFCGGKEFIEKIGKHYFLKLTDKNKLIKECANDNYQIDIKNMLNAISNQILEDWDFTRQSKLGLPCCLDENLSLYLWFESLVRIL